MPDVSTLAAYGLHSERVENESAKAVIDGDAIAGLDVGVFRKQRAKILDQNFFSVVSNFFA